MPLTYTPFSAIYEAFLGKITDDMYMQLTKEDTYKLIKDLFLSALHWFEFPRFDLYNYDTEKERYNTRLHAEEINIIATYMVVCWLDQQLASVQNTRMKYSGSDFKLSSQANHMSKLQALRREYQRTGFHLQRLYKRRAPDEYGVPRSTMDIIMAPMEYRPVPSRKRPAAGGGSTPGGIDSPETSEQIIKLIKEFYNSTQSSLGQLSKVVDSLQKAQQEMQQSQISVSEMQQQLKKLVDENSKTTSSLSNINLQLSAIKGVQDIQTDNMETIKDKIAALESLENTRGEDLDAIRDAIDKVKDAQDGYQVDLTQLRAAIASLEQFRQKIYNLG